MTALLPLRRFAPVICAMAAGTLHAQSTAPVNSSLETIELDPFQVVTQSGAGYGSLVSSSSSRLNMQYIDVPQTVSVITSEFLEDAFIFDSREFTKYVNNVVPRSNAHQVETYYVRGLQVTQTHVDGFLTSFGLNRDRALYDRIEYVKGPASAALGRGEASGLINYISKSPRGRDRTDLVATAGTDAFYRGEIDVERVFPGGSVGVRLPAYLEDSGGTRGPESILGVKKFGVGPSISWDISPETRLVFNGTLVDHQTPGVVGELWHSNRDIYLWLAGEGLHDASDWKPLAGDHFVSDDHIYGYPGKGRQSLAASASLVFTHRFASGLAFRQGLRWDDLDEEYRRYLMSVAVVADPAVPDDFLVSMSYFRQFLNIDGVRAQGDLLHQGRYLGGEQTVLVGYEISSRSLSNRAGQVSGLTQNLYRPSYDYPAGHDPETAITNYTTDSRNRLDTLGYFLHYSGKYWGDRLNVVAGWRADRHESTNDNRRSGARTSSENTTSVPRVSLTYKPSANTSLYVVHSRQEDPPSNRSRFGGWRAETPGALLPPPDDPRYAEDFITQVTARLNEIGFKANFFNNRVTAGVALFELERDGFVTFVPITEPGADGTGTILYNRFFTTKGEKVSGMEAELFGQPTERLTLYAAIATQNGTRPSSATTRTTIESLIDSLTLHAKYDLRDNRRNGWMLTLGGKVWFGGWNIWSNAAQIFADDQFSIDAGATYAWADGRYSVTAKVNNLTDETVVVTPNSQWGFRRAFVSFAASF